MNSFSCLRLSILAEAKDHIKLPPYQGSTLRGSFGYALKRAVCAVKNRECHECMLESKCVYSYAFETPPPSNAEVLRLYPYVPHPFIINPMTNGEGTHEPGNRICFGMTLVGRAIELLPYFTFGFIQMGKAGIGKGKGRFDVKQVDVLEAGGEKVETVYKDETLTSPKNILDFKQAEEMAGKYRTDRITVVFKTPLRVKYKGHLHDKLEFHIIIRNLLRRLSNLLYFHCGQKIELPFREIIKRAEAVETIDSQTSWFDSNRYSTRQKKYLKLGGVAGQATYSGNLAEFIPMLVLGTWVNIGKGTSFGLGSYILSEKI